MADMSERLLWVANNVYVGAAGAFQVEKYYRAEIMALAAVGMVTFLRDDTTEVSEGLRAQAVSLRAAALELSANARAAFFEKRSRPSMSGANPTLRKISAELEDAVGEMDEIAKQSLAG
jgi:hypothetical protein